VKLCTSRAGIHIQVKGHLGTEANVPNKFLAFNVREKPGKLAFNSNLSQVNMLVVSSQYR
jgi:hypothetical protein